MRSEMATLRYSHTQKTPLCLILYSTALICITLAWMPTILLSSWKRS